MPQHPLFYGVVKLRARRELLEQGYGRSEVRALMVLCDDARVDEAVASSGASVPQVASAIGDGSIIKAIMEFLQSEAGQALIKALLALLMSLI